MDMPKIVGVLNVTPDSYYDGGRYCSVDAALQRAQEMLQEGADILEVGGESTGPGSKDVSLEEELQRTIPVVKAIHEALPGSIVAIDTWKAEVARQAIQAGASLVNDVTAGRGDPDLLNVVARTEARLCVMHAKDPTPRTTVAAVHYDDVVATVSAFLMERVAAAERCGIDRARLILDPGLGHFVSSEATYSFQIIAGIPRLLQLGFPLLLSPSRKSFLAGPRNLPPAERLPATLAVSAIAVTLGASYLRTHDVREMRLACDAAARCRPFLAHGIQHDPH